MKYEFSESEILFVDVHMYDVLEAKYYLERLIASINTSEIKEVVVIHGFNRGKALQKYVRNDLKSNKIERRFLSLNQGRTSLILSS